jgi:hypothetical protein
VFDRGGYSWDESNRMTQEQYAFARVNSYIAKGKAWHMDADLREEKVVNTKLDESFSGFMENYNYHVGLSSSTAKKREAHWKKMQKYSDKDQRAYQDAPGDKAARKKGMPQSEYTKKYHAMYGEEVDELNQKFAQESIATDEFDEEVRSADIEGVVVHTADGKTVVRHQKRNRKIIGTGNLTDGKPDDTI